MKVVTTIQELRSEIVEYRKSTSWNEKVGFVPTMGFLHAGHMSLMSTARKSCGLVVLSIFVNPLQFGPNEDFERYPRDAERDLAMAQEAGVNLVFMPEVNEMYPQKTKTTVSVQELTSVLCGASRPGHFDGVATVVMKLFQIVQPDQAFFGMKDAQQVAVIQQMVSDLNMPVEIVPCPTLRESDGLAMSSRNVYLSEAERKQAVVLFEALTLAEQKIKDQSLQYGRLRELMVQLIESKPLAQIDYVELLSFPSLEPLTPTDQLFAKEEAIMIGLAVKFGTTRLIDNRILIASKEG